MPFTQIFKKWLKPHEVHSAVTSVHYDKLFLKGYRTALFDLDNTILPRHVDVPEWKIKQLFSELKGKGWRVFVLTNNSDQKRLVRAMEFLDVPCILQCMKPLPWIYQKLTLDHSVNLKTSIMVGDQLLTDILGANLQGCYSIYIHPIGRELSWIRATYIRCEEWLLNHWLMKRSKA